MSLQANDLWRILQLTITDPKRGLRMVLQIDLPIGAGVAGLALMAVASALLLHLSLSVSALPAGNPLMDMLTASPFGTALIQGVMLVVTAVLVQVLGRAWGGQGRFDQAIVAVVWLQAIFVALQALQLVALLVLAPLSTVIGLVSVGLFFWLLTHFVAELHGFTVAWKVFLGIIMTIVALSFVLSFFLVGLLGPEAFANG